MHPSWRVMASPNPAAQLNLIRWSHPIHQWSTSAWHPSVPPHRRFLRFFNVAGCEKPSADWIGSNKKQLKNTRIHWLWIQPSIVVYPSLALGWPSTSLGPLVRCCPNSWWGAFGAFKLFQPPICQCWTLPHPSAALLQPSKPPATNTRRSSKPATAQPERPTAMVGPEENVMLVASKILGDWETCVRLDKWTSSWALERRPALQQVAVCKTGIGSVSELLTWWIVAEGSLYSSMCILYVFFARTLRAQMICFTIKATKNDDTPGRHQQRTPRWGTSKGQGDDPQTSRLDAWASFYYTLTAKDQLQKTQKIHYLILWHFGTKSMQKYNYTSYITYQHKFNTNTKLVLNWHFGWKVTIKIIKQLLKLKPSL